MARTWYQLEIRNDELGEVKVVRGSTPAEAQAKAQKQLAVWNQRVQRQREQQRIQDLMKRSELQTDEAQARIDEWRRILEATLTIDDRVDWETLKDRREFEPPTPEASPPDLESIRAALNVPNQSWLEALWSPWREKRIALEQQAESLYKAEMAKYETYEKEFQQYVNKLRAKFENDQARRNAEIEAFREAYESGSPDAVERYAELVLERSIYPDGFEQEFELQIKPEAKLIVVDYRLPHLDSVPCTMEYRFVKSRQEIVPKDMSKREFAEFYESIACQTAVRTAHELLESDYGRHIATVAFNGWVNTVDLGTGQDTTVCIVSCQIPRDRFEQFDLSRIDPKETIKAVGGRISRSASELRPVDPLIRIEARDRKLVDIGDATMDLRSRPNLASMPPLEFEHLVGDLFREIFSQDGGVVEVTKASGDGGVDVIANLPSPIRGGKYVVQVKRYNGLVSPTAVRDLYGTVSHEGATKGILVTTGYFGHDSYAFAEDKPLDLIDGSQLVYLFQEHGFNVRNEINS